MYKPPRICHRNCNSAAAAAAAEQTQDRSALRFLPTGRVGSILMLLLCNDLLQLLLGDRHVQRLLRLDRITAPGRHGQQLTDKAP